MQTFFNLFDATLLSASLRIVTPVMLGALGYAICAKAGVIDMGIEGKLLFGAFVSAYTTYLTNNPWLGVLAAALLTALFNLLVSVLLIKVHAQQVIVGIGSNFFMTGVTTVLLNTLWGQPSTSPPVQRLDNTLTQALSKLPVIGGIFELQTPIMLLAFLFVVITWVVLYKMRIGLRLRSVGENPRAADSLGIKVHTYQFAAMFLCGLLCGIGGSDMTIGQLGYFGKEMIAGRGFIALACAVVGRFHPFGLMLISFLYAIIDALQVRLQGAFSFPGQFFQMIPYIAPIIVLAFFGGKKAPGGLGKPFTRGER